jgi:hypothetical protein
VKHVWRYLPALVLLVAGSALPLSGQVMQTADLDPSHPAAHRATEAVEALLTGDADGAMSALALITAQSVQRDAFEKQVQDVVGALGSPGTYRIDRMAPGPGGVMVLVVPTGEGSAMGIIVEMEPGEPHNLYGFRRVPVQLRSR